eukprot:TRINITY_DN16235_c0_g1_i1.p1 TRINITY_DN16235_c0_g1~~TRINITY_DN16235_c0_g1_i1.p1  ORF type:complete len:633 (-),score=136.14 TRINITY_DN16235_c0_g1_i1:44-1942(-)
MSAISSREVEIPTLAMDSAQLNNISLSGIIEQFINIPQDSTLNHQPVASIHLDPNSRGSENPIGYQINVTQHSQLICDNMNQYHNLEPHNNYNTMANGCPSDQKPYVRILEQPKANSLRFRYQCEGRGAGALQGQHSTPEMKTFPKIQIVGTSGPAVVVVSCVTHDNDQPRSHPHNLVSPASVGRDGCKRGVCTMNVNSEDMTVEFQHLGIQCVRKKDVEDSLKQRKEIRVDPFRMGWKHMENPSSIDLNAVKLCFQVFLENPQTPGKYTTVLPPVCSTSIFDAKAKKELQIMDISDVVSPAEGGKKIIILCEKVTREDIKVRFYDSYAWEAWGEFNPSEVHKQYAISMKTPRYKDVNIKEKTKVFVELVKPTDESTSEPQDFYYLPTDPGSLQASTIQDKKSNPSNFKVSQSNNFNGGCVKEIQEMRIKQESVDQGWNQAHNNGRMVGMPSYQQNYTGHQQMMNAQNSSYNVNNPISGYNMQAPGYIPNIPNVQSAGYMPQLLNVNPYACQQQSPDSQGFADMNIASPQHKQDDTFDQEVENLSGKVECFSLSDVIETSLNIQAPAEEQRSRGKRSSKTAALESGSNVVPREMARLQSSLETPDTSQQLNTPNDSLNLANYLTNCRQINDL